MMDDEPLLSGEETDALLDAMRASEGQAPRPVDSIDLTTPDRGLRDNLAYSDRAADRFCTEATRAFLKSVGVSTSLEPEPTEITPYDVFCSSMPSGSGIAVLRSEHGTNAILTVGPLLITAVLERRLGAPIDPEAEATSDPSTPEILSSVDRRVVRPFLAGLGNAFASAWCRTGTKLTLSQVVGRPEELPTLERSEPMLRLGWRVAPAGCPSDKLHIAIPSGFLFDVGPEEAAGNPTPSNTDRSKLIGRIQGTTVDVAAILGTARSTVRDVLKLRRGDVLRLAQVAGAPLELSAHGAALAWGQPCVHHGNMAIEIVPGSSGQAAHGGDEDVGRHVSAQTE